MQLFYDLNFTGASSWELSTPQSHHCINVMRMGVGASLWLSDGRGMLAECRVVSPHSKHCMVEVIGVLKDHNPRPYTLSLAVAPTKNIERIEWMVEKATEIGIDRFTPLLCERSERKVVKRDRLERIIESAAAQSEKAYLPLLDDITPFKEFVTNNPGGLIAHCIEGHEKIAVPPNLKHYTILIGPEGDFSPAELEFALAHNYTGLSLGSQRLRTETAALYAVAAAAILR